MRNLTWLVISGALLAASATLTRAETLEEVQKKLTERALSYKSLAYKQTLVSDTKIGDDAKTHVESDGTIEMLRKGEEYIVRSEQKMKTSSEYAGQKTDQSMRMLMIYDGEYFYTLSESEHGKQAMRQKMANLNNLIKKDMFKELEEAWDLKLLPDEKVNGRAAWVLEMRPKKQTANGQPNQAQEFYSRMVHWYDQETGIALKSIGYDKAGKESMKMTASDIKVNPDIPAERFKFTPPEGVPVIDMDALQQEMSDRDAGSAEPAKETSARSTSDEKPAEEKKATQETKQPEKKEEKKEKKGVKNLFDRLK